MINNAFHKRIHQAKQAEDETLFQECVEDAKQYRLDARLLARLTAHPPWLTQLGVGRNWTILHQLVSAGNVVFLQQVWGEYDTVYRLY